MIYKAKNLTFSLSNVFNLFKAFQIKPCSLKVPWFLDYMFSVLSLIPSNQSRRRLVILMHDVYSRVFGEQLQQMALPFTSVLWSHSPNNPSSALSVGSGPSKPNPLHFKHRTAVVSFTHPFLRLLEQLFFSS